MHKFPVITLILIGIYSGSFAQTDNNISSPQPNELNYKYIKPDWEKGGYIDLQGGQHDGLIVVAIDKNKNYFVGYKKEKHDKETTIPVDSVKKILFTQNDETLVASHSPLLKNIFIREVIIANDLKLYNQPVLATFSAAGVRDVWYYGPNKDELTVLDKRNFFNIMPQIMADRPYVVKNILNKQYKYSDMVDLITYYQTGREPWKDRDNQ